LSVYLDTSFLVSLYVTDLHSPGARRLIGTISPPWLTPLHHAEWTHALAQHIFQGQLTSAEVHALEKQLEGDKASGVWRATDLPESAFEVAIDLGRRSGPKLGVRTLDTLHVASAVELQAERFWSFDNRQAKLAKAVGLKTL
jgi:predicted nucleic acid-binding protein